MRRLLLLGMLVGCGGDSESAADASSPDAPVMLEDVHLYGRFTADKRFAWEGSEVATRFDGTSIDVEISGAGQGSWYEVIIDGVAQPAWHRTMSRTTLATGLAAGPHDIRITRRTEATVGADTFVGFPDATLVATPRKTRMIEMIGDSITAGYGVLGVGPTCNFSLPTEAETHAWGTFAADALGAAHVSLAVSGFGVYRGYSGTAGTEIVPPLYDLAIPFGTTAPWTWDYTPDVIVVALGTNDFAKGDPGAAFVPAYVDFVHALRVHAPAAQVLLATSPLLTDTYPSGGMHRTKYHAYLEQVVTQLADPAVSIVDIAAVDVADGWGCDYHPSEPTQHKMADALVPAIRAVTGW